MYKLLFHLEIVVCTTEESIMLKNRFADGAHGISETEHQNYGGNSFYSRAHTFHKVFSYTSPN
jgi:hypothetical protein